MKRVLKKVFCLWIIISSFNSCKLFNADINGFLEYYSGTSAVADVSFPETAGRASNGLLCIDSKADKTFNLVLRNPQGYGRDGDILLKYKFNNEKLNADGTLFPDLTLNEDLVTATMTFSKENLEKLEKGLIKDDDENIVKDLSGVCRIYANFSGSYFDGDYPVNFMVNSAPERIRGAMFQINGKKETTPNYVVAFNAPVIAGTVHEADTHHIYIGKNHWTFTKDITSLTPVYVEEGCSLSKTKPSALYDLDDKTSTFTPLPSSEGYVPLYFTSNEKMDDSSRVVTYKLSIVDDYGLSTNTVISNKPNKLQPPDFTTINANSLNKGESEEKDGIAYPADEESEEFKFVINHEGDTFYIDEDGTEQKGATCTNPIMIQYVVKQDGTVVQKGIKQAPVTLRLKSAINYTVEAYAYSDGIIDSVNAGTKMFGVSRSNIYYVDAGAPAGGTGSKTKPYKTIEHCFDTIHQQYNDFPQNDDPNEINSYTINLLSDLISSDALINIDGDNKSFLEDTEVIIQGYGKNYLLGCSGDGSAAVNLVNTKKMTLKLNNLVITSKKGTGIYVYTNKKVNLEMENVTVEKCQSGSEYAGIYFNVSSDEPGNLSLSNCKIIKNAAMNTSGAGINLQKGTISMKNQVVIADNTSGSTHGLGTYASNLYLSRNGTTQRVIIIDGPLSAESRIGVTCQTEPTVEKQVIFTSGYGSNNSSVKPYDIFSSDKNYAIRLKDNEVVLSKGGISFGEQTSQTVTLNYAGEIIRSLRNIGSSINFSALLNGSVDITSEVEWNFMLVINGDDISSCIQQGSSAQTKNQVRFVNTNRLVQGKYNLYAFANYNGKVYSTKVDITFRE